MPMNQPQDARDVLLALIDEWWRERRPPATLKLSNVHGEWDAPTFDFLADAVEQDWYGDDELPRSSVESVESITDELVGTYGEAAGALLDALPLKRGE